MLTRSIKDYVVEANEPLAQALVKLEKTFEKVLIVVDGDGRLWGTLSDGDVRRWIIKSHPITTSTAGSVANVGCTFLYEYEGITKNVNSQFKIFPVVTRDKKVVGLVKGSASQFQLGEISIGPGFPTFIIAEIGNNHNGDVDRAMKMVDIAKGIGANCAKFQMRHIDSVYRKRSLQKHGDDLGAEYVIDLLKRFELSVDEHRRLSEYCLETGILYMCTPWDLVSVGVLEEFGVPGYKVASADLTNIPLIDGMLDTEKPLILSTGMSTRSDIKFTVDLLNERNASFALLHCNSTYPAPFQDINLSWMQELAKLHPIVGYSGHERGTAVSLAAATMGASIIERHLTLDRRMEGPDHGASLEPNEFEKLISGIREIELAMGNGQDRTISQGEMINRENLGKSLVANREIRLGEVLDAGDIKIRSPGQGLSPQFYSKLIGRVANRDMREEDFFFPSDLNDLRVSPRIYKFPRPWGIPVRYHDFREFNSLIRPQIWEFHLSYSDMELDPEQYLVRSDEVGFAVHAPELFSNSMLMDLATPDESYRKQSLRDTQKVVEITRALKKFFPKTKKPIIVANIGGFTMDETLRETELEDYYERFASSLDLLDLEGVELTPQTMAPFPWHFGGQRLQNLFLRPEEIVFWCKKLRMRVCLDISHAKLTCNHFALDFYDYVNTVAPYVAHIHFGDASGVNGEGLQIGSGEINFARLAKIINSISPEVSFIPEIWQGHKNYGEGFWVALDRLEKFLN